MIEPLLTSQDVSRLLKVSLPLVYKLAERGQIPCIRWKCPGNGKRARTTVRFKKEDVFNFIETNYRQ